MIHFNAKETYDNNPYVHKHIDLWTDELYSKQDLDSALENKSDKISISSSIPTTGMLPDVMYALGEISADPNVTLAAAPSDGKDHEWMLTFATGATAPASVTFPDDVVFTDTPTFEASKHYEVSMKWDATDEVYYGLIQSWDR